MNVHRTFNESIPYHTMKCLIMFFVISRFEHSFLQGARREFNRKFFLVKKSEIVSLKPEQQSETHFLKRRISVDEFGWHVELDQRYVKSLLDAMVMNHGKSMATPGSKGQESSRNVADLTEKLEREEHREFRSGVGICQFLTEQRFDTACSTEEIMREAAGPTTASKTKDKIEENRALLQRTPAMCVEFPLGGKAGRAGNPKTRCSTS